MSFSPNPSPYASPMSKTTDPTAAGTKPPGPFVAISVIAIVLGSMGLIGSCFGAMALAMQGAVGSMVEQAANQPGVDQSQMIAFKAAQEAQKANLPILIVAMGLSTVVSLSQVVSGSLGAMKKPVSVILLQLTIGMAILLNLINPVIGYINTNSTMAAQTEMMESMEMDQQQRDAMKMGQSIGLGVGIGISVLTAVTMLGMYVAGLLYLIRSQKLAAFMAARRAMA